MPKLTNTNDQPRKELLIGKSEPNLEKLDLIEIQKNSWNQFLTKNLREILQEFFPVEDYTGKKFTLEFEDFYFGEPRYPLALCKAKKLTYDTPVYLKLKLINKKMNQEKKQDVYFFNLPKMTDRCTS